jgi:hypothetical protein
MKQGWASSSGKALPMLNVALLLLGCACMQTSLRN